MAASPRTLLFQHRAAKAPGSAVGLVMSATLVPPPSAVARHDPALRLADYLDALRFYLQLPDAVLDRILFIDNSDSDLSALAAAIERVPHRKDVQLISFQGNDHSPSFGKAYGEFRLLDHGLSQTTLFQPGDVVWKTTGRLKILNLPALVQRSQARPFDLMCDLHNVPWVGSGAWRGHENMDLRVFAFRHGSYLQHLKGLWQGRATGFDAHFMYHHVLGLRSKLALRPRFPIQAQLQGVSGRHLRDYMSASQRAKDGVRSLLRQVAPGLWL